MRSRSYTMSARNGEPKASSAEHLKIHIKQRFKNINSDIQQFFTRIYYGLKAFIEK